MRATTGPAAGAGHATVVDGQRQAPITALAQRISHDALAKLNMAFALRGRFRVETEQVQLLVHLFFHCCLLLWHYCTGFPNRSSMGLT